MDDDEKTVSSNVDEDMASMMLAAGAKGCCFRKFIVHFQSIKKEIVS